MSQTAARIRWRRPNPCLFWFGRCTLNRFDRLLLAGSRTRLSLSVRPPRLNFKAHLAHFLRRWISPRHSISMKRTTPRERIRATVRKRSSGVVVRTGGIGSVRLGRSVPRYLCRFEVFCPRGYDVFWRCGADCGWAQPLKSECRPVTMRRTSRIPFRSHIG